AHLMLDMGRIVAAAKGNILFLAELDGQVIGTGGLSIHDGVALFAGASTVPAWRRRGVQRALLEARFQYARAAGCDLAMMGAEPGSSSQRNAERQGFRIAYTRTKWTLAG
ncbi:MAG TPA: GNAT family N-acetyltransferase, partial [Candidatus Eremiobacteraceae bacterium]|nr:GNAT family N-acetyltransferase [Candidatus Eremiobacteraceae bacterium]